MWRFDFQSPIDSLVVPVDTDFAGDYETRRSTSGGAGLRGSHLIKHWSQTQSTIALSSAEAELSGICKGASIGLGLLAVAKDLGMTWTMEVQTDATAAIGICRRKGLGKIRHLATADLWVQDRIRRGDFSLTKIEGSKNPADALTTHLDRCTLEKHMRSLSLFDDWGRAETAPMV